MEKSKRYLKNICIVLAFPIIVGGIMEILSLIVGGTHLMTSILDVKNLIRNCGISACIALALSFNIPSGRFDLSLGAQNVTAVIVGGNIALMLHLGGIGVLIFSVLFGALFGLLVGGTFVILKIPPMVLGVGMALILECIGFASFDSQGLQVYGAENVEILSNMPFVILVVIVVAFINLFIMNYTSFGYHHRAIQGNQKIARNSGINIFSNAVLCYVCAGMFVAVSGVFDAAYKGMLDAGLGLTSTGTVMSNCFPMFLGEYIGRWCNRPVGIIVACVTIKLYSAGLGAFNLDTNASQLANIATFLVFLIFLANENVFRKRKAVASRIKEAKQVRAQLGL